MTKPTIRNPEPHPADRDGHGYRVLPGHGPRVRSDVIDVYVARQSTPPGTVGDLELLQLRRSKSPLLGTWQPIMGHIEPGETAVAAALRELREEIALDATNPSQSSVVGFWALEQVHPFYIAAIDCIVLSPRFVVLVRAGFEPTRITEHDAHRWVHAGEAQAHFVWPGQLAAIKELLSILASPQSPAFTLQRIDRHSYARP